MHGNQKMKPVQKVAMFAVQGDIYKIVAYFMNEPTIKLKRIYKEGVTIENEKAVNNKDKSINTIEIAGLKIREIIYSRFNHELETIQINKRLLEIDFTDNQLFYLSAAFQLHRNKRLYLEAAESKLANFAATRIKRNSVKINYYQRQEDIYVKRELLLLELIAKNGDAIAFTIYGGGHDFDKEIDIWNKKHPDDMFCLVEITPRPYFKFYILNKVPKLKYRWPPRNE